MIVRVLCRIYLIFRCDETTGSWDDSRGLLGRDAAHGEIVVISGYVARWSPSRTKLRKLWMLFDCMPATPHNRQLPWPRALHVFGMCIEATHIERRLCEAHVRGTANRRNKFSQRHTRRYEWPAQVRHVSFKSDTFVWTWIFMGGTIVNNLVLT